GGRRRPSPRPPCRPPRPRGRREPGPRRTARRWRSPVPCPCGGPPSVRPSPHERRPPAPPQSWSCVPDITLERASGPEPQLGRGGRTARAFLAPEGVGEAVLLAQPAHQPLEAYAVAAAQVDAPAVGVLVGLQILRELPGDP